MHLSGHHQPIREPRQARPYLQRTVTAASDVEAAATTSELAQFLEDPCPPESGSVREAQWLAFLRMATDAAVQWMDREAVARTVTTAFDAYAQGRVPPAGLLPMALPEPLWLDLPRVKADPATVTVELVDSDGAAQTLSADRYDMDTDSTPHRLHLHAPPSRDELAHFLGLRVTYTAGSASVDEVPQAIKLGVLTYAAWLYERRGMGAANGFTESGARDMLRPYAVKVGL